jgi:thioesterase domain-containing protein
MYASPFTPTLRNHIRGGSIFKAGEIGYRPPLNWQELMTGELQMYESAGGHMDLTKEPYVAVWAAKLRDALDSVTAGTAGVCESGAAEA